MIFFAVRRLVWGGFRTRRWRGELPGWRPYGRMRDRHREFSQTPVPAAPAPAVESTFELLKKRYVKGELSDEQYERALDDLLKTPEGRGMVG